MSNIIENWDKGSEKTEKSAPKISSESEDMETYTTGIFQAFVAAVTNSQRRGQAWMNALGKVDPDKYREISGTEADCFYDDKKIAAFKLAVFGKAGE